MASRLDAYAFIGLAGHRSGQVDEVAAGSVGRDDANGPSELMGSVTENGRRVPNTEYRAKYFEAKVGELARKHAGVDTADVASACDQPFETRCRSGSWIIVNWITVTEESGSSDNFVFVQGKHAAKAVPEVESWCGHVDLTAQNRNRYQSDQLLKRLTPLAPH